MRGKKGERTEGNDPSAERAHERAQEASAGQRSPTKRRPTDTTSAKKRTTGSTTASTGGSSSTTTKANGAAATPKPSARKPAVAAGPATTETRSEAATAPSARTIEPTRTSRREASEAEIRARAYELYLSRGGADGDAEADWLAAERQILGDE